jgi:hypothetical protein
MAKQEAPTISQELVEWLEKIYPDKAPNLKDPEREIWMKVGQVDVVKKLRSHFEKARERPLDSVASTSQNVHP